MTSLKDAIAQQELLDALLNLTNDLITVVGIKVTSPRSAEVWISTPATRDTILTRCAEHDVLSAIELAFREELDEANTSGGAANRPRTWEPKNDDRPNDLDAQLTAAHYGPPEALDE